MKEHWVTEARELWQSGEAVMIDIREQHEYDATHVDGMPLIPMSELQDRLDELPTDKPIILFCRSGNRSGQVADYLTGLGDWGAVANCMGGIIAWAEAGLPYEGAPPT